MSLGRGNYSPIAPGDKTVQLSTGPPYGNLPASSVALNSMIDSFRSYERCDRSPVIVEYGRPAELDRWVELRIKQLVMVDVLSDGAAIDGDRRH